MKRRQTQKLSFKQYVKNRKLNFPPICIRDEVLWAIRMDKLFPNDVIKWEVVRWELERMKQDYTMTQAMIKDAYKLWLNYCGYMKRMRFSVEPDNFGVRVVASKKE